MPLLYASTDMWHGAMRKGGETEQTSSAAWRPSLNSNTHASGQYRVISSPRDVILDYSICIAHSEYLMKHSIRGVRQRLRPTDRIGD